MMNLAAATILLIVIAFIIYVASQPDRFRIERSVIVSSKREKIFALLSSFKQWEGWSPWETIDPQVVRIYSGSNSGEGAVYEWKGNKNVGSGRMEIISCDAPSRLTIKIDFLSPFEAHNIVEFVLASNGETTTVTQAMYGPQPFMGKLIGLFFCMEKMVGGKYEEGLANLKRIAES